MRDPTDATADVEALRAPRAPAAPRDNPFVQIAPGPETPDVRDKAGRQRGMVLAIVGAGAFWAAVGAAAVYFLRG
jgi:hypothetical protein